MRERKKFRCERIRSNNGIVEVLFTKREGSAAHEEHVLVNLIKGDLAYREGQLYWIEITPAFPH